LLNQVADRFVELRVVNREDGPSTELSDEAADPRRDERERYDRIEPAHRDPLFVEMRRDQPEEIDEPNDQHAYCDLD
jgi:hypothetical protein